MKRKTKRIAGGSKILTIVLILFIVLAFTHVQYVVNIGSIITHGVYVKLYNGGSEYTASTFHDAYRDGEYVCYRCTVTIANREPHEKQVKLRGISLRDYIFGHIESPFLDCVDINGNECIIDVGPNEVRTVNWVYFRGKFVSLQETLKYDRSLPLIYLEIL